MLVMLTTMPTAAQASRPRKQPGWGLSSITRL